MLLALVVFPETLHLQVSKRGRPGNQYEAGESLCAHHEAYGARRYQVTEADSREYDRREIDVIEQTVPHMSMQRAV